MITSEGSHHLGAVIGSHNFSELFVKAAVNNLVSVAKMNPHLSQV